MPDLLTATFCNCCYTGCDCGCIEDCLLVRHKEAAATESEAR